jgi:hypothetical protein
MFLDAMRNKVRLRQDHVSLKAIEPVRKNMALLTEAARFRLVFYNILLSPFH